jgi:hypothetical protein
MVSIRRVLLLLGTFVFVIDYPALANLITNGSFEAPLINTQYLDIAAGSEPAGFGWRVTSGTVDIGIAVAFPSPFDGVQFLDLDGFGPGAIGQSFTTIPGAGYVLNFVYANNPYGGGTNCTPPSTASCATIPAHGTVSIVDGSTTTPLIAPLVLTHSNSTVANANWTPSGDIAFVAHGTTTTLSFASNDPSNSNGGIFLDAVSVNAVSAVPEPSSFVLLLLGLSAASVLGAQQRRRV